MPNLVRLPPKPNQHLVLDVNPLMILCVYNITTIDAIVTLFLDRQLAEVQDHHGRRL